MLSLFNRAAASPAGFPLASLALCLLAFGLFVPFLGFYWDDWETILVLKQFSYSTLWDYFAGSRPLAAWTYFVFAPLAGTAPLGWHILSLLLRWLSAFLLYRLLLALFPNSRFTSAAAALLFIVYPVFIQQPIAVAYHQHWTAFALYLIAMLCMVWAIQRRGNYWLLTALSLFASALHLAVLEYFFGLEFLRPLILWLTLENQEPVPRRRWKAVLRHFTPYLMGITLFFAWRMFYAFQAPEDNNRPQMLINLLAQPLSTLLNLLQSALQDIVFMLVSAWYKTLEPRLVILTSGFNLAVWAIALLAGTGAALFLYWQEKGAIPHVSLSVPSQNSKLLIFGTAALLLGFAPVWLTGRQVSLVSQNTDRFGLAAMFGASIILAALLSVILTRPRFALVIGMLVGLAVGLHLRVANDYRWSWTKQLRVHWQLAWRAPLILPETTFYSDGDIHAYNRPTFSFNLLYNQPSNPAQMAYRYLILPKTEAGISENATGKSYESVFRNFRFKGDLKNGLLLHYNPLSNCLWVLNSLDTLDPELPEALRLGLPLANLERIQRQPSSPPPQDVFGKEPTHEFCYYYQKADLARQFGDWTAGAALADEARARGYTPKTANFPHEWLPLIESYARSGRAAEALELSRQILPVNVLYRPALCALWQRAGSPREALQALNCP